MPGKLIYALPSLIIFLVGFGLMLPGLKRNWEVILFKRESPFSPKIQKLYKIGVILAAVGLISLIAVNKFYLKK